MNPITENNSRKENVAGECNVDLEDKSASSFSQSDGKAENLRGQVHTSKTYQDIMSDHTRQLPYLLACRIYRLS